VISIIKAVVIMRPKTTCNFKLGATKQDHVASRKKRYPIGLYFISIIPIGEIDFSNELADELKNLITASMGLEKYTV